MVQVLRIKLNLSLHGDNKLAKGKFRGKEGKRSVALI